MKGKLAFLLGMALRQCFVWGYGEFQTLRMVFSSWQGHPNEWRMAFEQTHNLAEETAKNIADKMENYNCTGDDLKAIRAFAVSFPCLESFLMTEEFSKNSERYGAWLKNLCYIACNVAKQKAPVICSNFEELSKQLLGSSIEDLCKDGDFLNVVKRIGNVLTDAIDWEEEE